MSFYYIFAEMITGMMFSMLMSTREMSICYRLLYLISIFNRLWSLIYLSGGINAQ